MNFKFGLSNNDWKVHDPEPPKWLPRYSDFHVQYLKKVLDRFGQCSGFDQAVFIRKTPDGKFPTYAVAEFCKKRDLRRRSYWEYECFFCDSATDAVEAFSSDNSKSFRWQNGTAGNRKAVPVSDEEIADHFAKSDCLIVWTASFPDKTVLNSTAIHFPKVAIFNRKHQARPANDEGNEQNEKRDRTIKALYPRPGRVASPPEKPVPIQPTITDTKPDNIDKTEEIPMRPSLIHTYLAPLLMAAILLGVGYWWSQQNEFGKQTASNDQAIAELTDQIAEANRKLGQLSGDVSAAKIKIDLMLGKLKKVEGGLAPIAELNGTVNRLATTSSVEAIRKKLETLESGLSAIPRIQILAGNFTYSQQGIRGVQTQSKRVECVLPVGDHVIVNLSKSSAKISSCRFVDSTSYPSGQPFILKGRGKATFYLKPDKQGDRYLLLILSTLLPNEDSNE